MKIVLNKVKYQLMEYEKRFNALELSSFFPGVKFVEKKDRYEAENMSADLVPLIYYLTYIESYVIDDETHQTLQGKIENDGTPITKQHTRYSTHGLHEYKGKFNPQIVRAIINYLKISRDATILDPFNGSGTTILECAHENINAFGADINPMACFISNTKISSLGLDVEKVKELLAQYQCKLQAITHLSKEADDERLLYLTSWIPEPTLAKLEYIFLSSNEYDVATRDYLRLIASDLIRDYSYQEPSDLRIRRRISPFPQTSFEDAFYSSAIRHLEKIQLFQACGVEYAKNNRAITCDISKESPVPSVLFDAAITSPPYATALPYIDTQRISLVWLGLCPPDKIKSLEASLIGSRELLKREQAKWEDHIVSNSSMLPPSIQLLIEEMHRSLSDTDGFRKQAVPALMYRYFSEMKDMFLNLKNIIKVNGYYALVVGHNKSTLGGKQFFLDTPSLLADLAESCGWTKDEIVPLQTYARYGLNSKNSINQESLIVLRNIRKEPDQNGVSTSTECV